MLAILSTTSGVPDFPSNIFPLEYCASLVCNECASLERGVPLRIKDRTVAHQLGPCPFARHTDPWHKRMDEESTKGASKREP